MRVVLFLMFLSGSLTLSAQNYLAFDTKKTGEERRAVLVDKSKIMNVKYVKPFDLGIKSSVVTNSAVINILLNETTDSLTLQLYDSQGEDVELLFDGTLPQGQHQFQFIPRISINRPFIAVLRMGGKIQSMRVVKFNAF